MKAARVFEKELMIPTYDVGKEEKNPMFLKTGLPGQLRQGVSQSRD